MFILFKKKQGNMPYTNDELVTYCLNEKEKVDYSVFKSTSRSDLEDAWPSLEDGKQKKN